MANGGTVDPLSPAAQHLPALAAMHKSDEWAYEREWRLLCIELNEPAGLAVAMPTPSALHLGSRMQASYRSSILEVAATAGIPCYEAALAGATFALERRPIKV